MRLSLFNTVLCFHVIHNYYTIKLVLFGNYVTDVLYKSSGKLKMNHTLILVYGECIRVIQQHFNYYKHKEIMILRKHKHYQYIAI